eukprot:m.105037 g.105037  ORF g.105037 m.105037 type:complete len:336 (-) comp27615_c0_seq1:82-1089(-)
MVCITVVGAGVVGLSTAIVLAESGIATEGVTVVHDAPTSETTSYGAGALWRPAFSEDPSVIEYGKLTYERLSAILTSIGPAQSGLSKVSGREYYVDATTPEPAWKHTVENFCVRKGDALGRFSEQFALAHEYVSVMINSPLYLEFLIQRATQLGITFVRAHCDDLDQDVIAQHVVGSIVINCTGVSASLLTHDNDLMPVKGQTVKILAPSVKEFMVVPEGPLSLSYIMPRGDGTVLLGGTHEVGATQSFATVGSVRDILSRCAQLMPCLEEAQVVDVWAGSRPTRSTIRIETEILPSSKTCIHNYGHGGSGMTVHWGCALEVLRHVEQTLRTSKM